MSLAFFTTELPNDLIYKTETQRKNQGGKREMNWETGIDIYTLLILCVK